MAGDAAYFGAVSVLGQKCKLRIEFRMKIHNHNEDERRTPEPVGGTSVEVCLSPDAWVRLEKIARDRGCRKDDVVEDAINSLFAELERTRETLSGGVTEPTIEPYSAL